MDQREEKAAEATPTVYDADYIEKALASAFKCESLRVESFHSEPITQHGENFCSVIYRLKVTYRKCKDSPLEQGNYVLKDLIPIVAEVGSNEKLMFEQILPAMAEIMDRTKLEEHKLSADCLFAEKGTAKEIYLLEDLGALGYKSFNRQVGLSKEDALLCVEKLAQFHAASMLLLHEQPELVSQLKPSHYGDGISDAFARVIISDGTAFAAEEVAKMPGMAGIAGKMKAQLDEEYSKRLRDVVDGKKSIIPVIAHGDLWLNNIMINAEKKKAIIVDFQNCFVGSPAIDLLFFFYTSLQLDVLLHQKDAIQQHYHQHLCQSLAACNYPGAVPSYAQLVEEVQRCLFYGYYAVACELPLCSVSKEAAEDFTVHTFIDSDAILNKRRQLFTNDRVLQTLKATLPYFEEQGILEAL